MAWGGWGEVEWGWGLNGYIWVLNKNSLYLIYEIESWNVGYEVIFPKKNMLSKIAK